MRPVILFISLAAIHSCSQNNNTPKETELREERQKISGKDSIGTTVNADTVKTKPVQDTIAQPLILSPLKVDGNIGQVTFSRKGKTVFYYDATTKKGKINLNGVDHILTKMEGGYILSGNNVSISTTKGKWEDMVSDCAYGKSLVVTIKMGSQVLELNDVEVQDCSSMVE